MPKPKQQLNPSQELIKRHFVEVMRCGKAGDRRGEGAAYGNLGNAYYSLGQFTRAVEYYNKCLTIALEVGDRAGEGQAYGNLAAVHEVLGQSEQAQEYKQKLSALEQHP